MAWTHRPGLTEKLTIVRESVQTMGVTATLRRVAEYVLSDKPQRDHSFDRRHATDTAGSVAPSQLGIEEEDALRDAVQYLPSPAPITQRLLRALAVDPRDWVFVDFGCGKGRVLLVAAAFGFKRVIGVEISSALARIAQQNLRDYRGASSVPARVEVRCADARTVELPREDTVFHLYHPFNDAVLRTVLENIRASVAAHPRRVRIVYLGAFEAALDVLAEFDFVTRRKFVRCIEPKYSWALFSNE